jgi:hypothetical protein
LGKPSFLYIPPATAEQLGQADVDLLITEGEKKAARADQDGFACVGLVGVYGFLTGRPKDTNEKAVGQHELIQDLAIIEWRDRNVFIVYDSDLAANAKVQKAEPHLAGMLEKLGAKVFGVPPRRRCDRRAGGGA